MAQDVSPSSQSQKVGSEVTHKLHVGNFSHREENRAWVVINELLKILIPDHGVTVWAWSAICKPQQSVLWGREYIAFRTFISIWGYGIELNFWKVNKPKQMRKCIAWTWVREKNNFGLIPILLTFLNCLFQSLTKKNSLCTTPEKNLLYEGRRRQEERSSPYRHPFHISVK